jgi:hypothetical protein
MAKKIDRNGPFYVTAEPRPVIIGPKRKATMKAEAKR